MSPSLHPAAGSTNRRRSALRLPVVAGLSLALAVPALAACQDESGPARPSASSSASSSAKKSDKSAEPSEKPSKESKNSNVEYVPSWEFPQSHSGWNVTVYDVDGKNKMDKQNGCVFTATQNLYAQTTKDDQAESGYQADAVIDAYQKSSDFTNVSFEPTKDDSTLVKDTDGHAIETKRLDFTYTGADHKDYKLTRVVRVFSTVGRPVMLQGMYACPVNVYSSSEMEELFKATPISNPGPADMDEGSSSDGAGKDGNDGKKSESEDKKSDEKSSGSSPKDT
ncbi:hypothetical protein AoKodu_09810 [Actinomyces oris K20]|uniref:hypothetical protein n=1 Tax=Actinomyces oris TaxID=544580 RepID=UPI000A8371D4|nr:hypothetical protein [Actinomyces oris]BDF98680.1 hypothetical protein AoKodu_09810 [Actinomyces oris K20]